MSTLYFTQNTRHERVESSANFSLPSACTKPKVVKRQLYQFRHNITNVARNDSHWARGRGRGGKKKRVAIAWHHLTAIWWEYETCFENVLFYAHIYLICISCYVVAMLRLCFNGRSIISDYCRPPRRRHIPTASGRAECSSEREREKKYIYYGNVNVYVASLRTIFLRYAEWTKFVSSHITFYGALIRWIANFYERRKKQSLTLKQLNMLYRTHIAHTDSIE